MSKFKIFMICFVILNSTLLVKVFQYLNYQAKTDYLETKIEELDKNLNDIEILKARKKLKDLDRQINHFNRLQAYCIKRINPPILMTEIASCKNEAIQILGYSDTYITLKTKAIEPLKSEL